MAKEKSREEIKEQIQQDLMCFLDGLGDDVLDRVCEIVIENFNSPSGAITTSLERPI